MDSHNIKFLSTCDIANILNVCYQKALDFIKFSGVSYVKIGRTYRVEEKVFYDFVLRDEKIEIDLEKLRYEDLKKRGVI